MQRCQDDTPVVLPVQRGARCVQSEMLTEEDDAFVGGRQSPALHTGSARGLQTDFRDVWGLGVSGLSLGFSHMPYKSPRSRSTPTECRGPAPGEGASPGPQGFCSPAGDKRGARTWTG